MSVYCMFVPYMVFSIIYYYYCYCYNICSLSLSLCFFFGMIRGQSADSILGNVPSAFFWLMERLNFSFFVSIFPLFVGYPSLISSKTVSNYSRISVLL